ncbi:diaminopimelate decarboxylase [Virgibacillus pantothenticus]|uniref:diaminopimelate decarboxylase n=1 Tax=Virgibacillus pantothenticus TaxID=1473 RepID=UPI000984B617|nr:diaminopimelate decarboxylase [Virgibacillus pantothenticus]GIP63142.1 diaminopimelate decarboxylase [Virgibacillus pantothenticus]
MKNKVDFQAISTTYGTPLYLYSGEELEQNYNHLRNHLTSSLEIFYSLKANPNISIYSFLHSLGAKAEVSSKAELLTVLKCGTNPQDIIFLGPGKSSEELEMCISNNIYSIVCESFQELELINQIAQNNNRIINVSIRTNPSFTIKGARLTMGGKSRQFGIDEEILLGLNYEDLSQYKNICIIGFHTYMGTRILDETVIVENTVNILRSAELLSEKLKINLEMVDIGGGLGVPYFDGEVSINIENLCRELNPVIEQFQNKHPRSRLIMELGRYLTATSGMYITKVSYVKESRGELFAITDGGTNHHMAAVGIGSFVKRNFPIVSLSSTSEQRYNYNISGPLCTPNDTIGKNVSLPKLFHGDLIGIENSGAYGPTASPTLFLSHGYPAEVLHYQGEHYLIRERDSVDSMLSKQILHELKNESVKIKL